MKVWNDPIAIILGMIYAQYVYGAYNKGSNEYVKNVYGIDISNEVLASILVESTNKNVINNINITITGNANYVIE